MATTHEKRCPQSGTTREVTNSAGGRVQSPEIVKGCPECGRELLLTVEAGADATYATLPEHDYPDWLLAARGTASGTKAKRSVGFVRL